MKVQLSASKAMSDPTGIVVHMTHAELVRILVALDAAERNYRGQPHGISDMAAQAMCTHIETLRKELELFQ